MWVQKVPGGGVVSLAFAPDGRTLYTADRGGWLTAWNPLAHVGKRLFRLPNDEHAGYRLRLSVLPDGALFTRAANLIVWEPDGRERHRVPGTPDVRVIRVCGSRLHLRTDTSDRVATWELLRGEPGPTLSGWDILGAMRTFDLGPDGRTAALTDTHGYVTVFDTEERREVDRFEPSFSGWPLSDARFSPDGTTLLLSAGPRVRFWDVDARAPRAEVVLGAWHHFDIVSNPRLPLFVSLDRNGRFTLFRLENGEPVRSLDFALGAQVLCAAFSPDGLTCAIGGSNRQFAVFDVDV